MRIKSTANRLHHGQLVEVRSESEILTTLDDGGKLEGLPFMPEMVRFCGRRFRVYRRADRTCVEGHGQREMNSAVFLEDVRCDGAFHDGCQRGCLIFWKEAWLRLVEGSSSNINTRAVDGASRRLCELPMRKGDRYFCQSTELHAATTDRSRRPRSGLASLISDVRYGELSVWRFLRIVGRIVLNRLRNRLGLRPPLIGVSGPGTEKSKGDLRLRSGEWVEIRKLEEIQSTLSVNGYNRGLLFSAEMLKCKGRHEVAAPVERIILEKTGKMIHLTNTVALKGIVCDGLCAMNCPRANIVYWREIWLRRVDAAR